MVEYFRTTEAKQMNWATPTRRRASDTVKEPRLRTGERFLDYKPHLERPSGSGFPSTLPSHVGGSRDSPDAGLLPTTIPPHSDYCAVPGVDRPSECTSVILRRSGPCCAAKPDRTRT